MLWWPQYSQTIVLPIGGQTALELLKFHTQAPSPAEEVEPDPFRGKTLFNGYIHTSGFTISRRVSYPENALPLVKGQIEKTSLGCIIHLHYRPFVSSMLFLGFWLLVALALGLFFWLVKDNLPYALIAFAALPVNYLIIVINFNRQVKRTNEDLYAVFKDVLE